MKHDNESSTLPAGYKTPLGRDILLDYMREHQLPLTRKNYLDLAGLKEPLEAELEGELPKEFQLTKTRGAPLT